MDWPTTAEADEATWRQAAQDFDQECQRLRILLIHRDSDILLAEAEAIIEDYANRELQLLADDA